MRRAFRLRCATIWLAATAVATAVLAVFAIFAWNEATHGTAALRNQLEIMRADQRPWVGFEVDSSSAKRGEKLTATFIVKNVGKSPALKVHAAIDAQFLKYNSEDSVPECTSCSFSLLIPGASVKYPISIPGEMTDYKKTPPAIFGRVDYEDTDGNQYWTTVCRYYEVAYSTLSSCSQGNDVGTKAPMSADKTSKQ
jgi:hypothetical protein